MPEMLNSHCPKKLAGNNTVVIHSAGPTGKSAFKNVFKEYFGCHSIVEEWQPGQPIVKGALYLTNTPIENPPSHVTQLTTDQAFSMFTNKEQQNA